jgi:hypothetical protein
MSQQGNLTASMELSRELEAEGIQGLLFPSVVGGDDNLVVLPRQLCPKSAFPQERTRGHQSDGANRRQTQMKNRPFPAIAHGTDV